MAHKEESDTVNPSRDDLQEYKSTSDFGLLPIPRRLRYDPDKTPHFGLMINIAFGLFSTFSRKSSKSLGNAKVVFLTAAANLYYCQPMLSEQIYYVCARQI